MRRETVYELFYIRGLCAFGIFMIHLSGAFAVFSQYGSKAMHLGILANQLFRFGTPVFMMISGFVLFYNYRNFDEFDYRKFYIKKVKYIAVPYFIWSIFYYLLNHHKTLISTGTIELGQVVKTILLGNAYPHLYFIFLIFQFYLLYPLFLKFFIKWMERKPLPFFVVLLLAQGAILIYEFYFKAYSQNSFINFFNSYYWKSVFGWFYYFLTGGLIALHYDKVINILDKNGIKIIFVYFISMILYIGEVYLSLWAEEGRKLYERYGSIRPMTLIYATFSVFLLIYIGRKIHNRDNKFRQMMNTFGVYSLGIYFAHPFVLEFIKTKLISRYPSIFGYSRISTMLILVILGWFSTLLLVLLLSKLKFRMYIIGRVQPYSFNLFKRSRSIRKDIDM
ncbi:MAG: acyltransferase [Clostridiales bacterium]|nr:acyltransferase [Clostridiales bacterium]